MALKRYIKILLSFILVVVFFTSCTSSDKKVEKQLTDDLSKIVNLDEKTVDSIISVTKDEKDNLDYKNLVMEMLKNLRYNIISTEYDKEEELVTIEIEFITKNIDILIDDFYKTIINESTNIILSGKEVDKDEIFNSGIKTMLEEYKKSFDTLEDVNSTIKLKYNKDEKKNWVLSNKEEYYNALLGGLFTKVDDYNENKLSSLFINSFLSKLKDITVDQIAILLNANDETKKTTLFQIYAKFYNNLEYKIIKSEKSPQGTKFDLEIKIVDAKKLYSEFNDKYVQYFKSSIDAKKTPSNTELTKKTYDLFMESFENNKDNKVVKETNLIVNNSLKIENLEKFFETVLIDIINESVNSNKEVSQRIANLYN